MLMLPEKKLTEHALALANTEWGPPAPLSRYLSDMAEAAEPAPEVINGTWFVVVVEPQQEGAVAGGLIGRRFAAYYPTQPKSVKSNYRKRRIVQRAMLPGYIFTSFDPADPRWKRIAGIAGVSRILMVDERPIPVPESALRYIRFKEEQAQADFKTRKRLPMPCKVGDWVQITEHFSFTGFLGHVVEILDDKSRIVLEVDLFGRQTPVEVSVGQIRSI